MAQDPYRYFRPEARNLLDQFAQSVLELENSGASASAVQQLLRLAHTLKGAARVVRQSVIAEHAHAIEDALAPFRDGKNSIARDTIDTILTHLDEIGGQLAGLADGNKSAGNGQAGDAPKPGATIGPAKSTTAEASRPVRTEIVEMDAVLDGVSETQAKLAALRRNADAVGQAGHLIDLLGAQLRTQGTGGRGREPSAQTAAIVEELRRRFGKITRDFGTTIAQIDRELRQLRDTAEGLRLVPVDSLLTALARTARDSAHALSKQVGFEGTGGDIRLDADVLAIIQGALIQIVRNAVAHGIESDDDRRKAGKPPGGRITVEVSRRGAKVLFTCRDDGRGIDLAAVRRVAVERGLIGANATEFSADDLMRMLLRGGISTSNAVTAVSGRGVGLDVVREALERVGGDVAVRVDPGRGTTFELVIPRSVAAVETLVVDFAPVGAKASAAAIPFDGVRRILRLAAADIACAATGASVLYEQKAIPFIPLATALNGSKSAFDRAWTAVVVDAGEGCAAIGIERLAGTARTVVRPLPDLVHASPLVAGVSLDSEGNPRLILDPERLVAAARDGTATERDPTPAKRPVLVVDDSLTTRMLEQSILESAGYAVDVACSAEEALETVRQKPFSLILCDVEMPGIDGFTFVERIKSDAALRHIPAILVSSRAAPEDRQRGRAVGAHGYIVKSEFNQAELLAMIRPMMS